MRERGRGASPTLTPTLTSTLTPARIEGALPSYHPHQVRRIVAEGGTVEEGRLGGFLHCTRYVHVSKLVSKLVSSWRGTHLLTH